MIAVPALRVRGSQLAIVTLAAAVAVERFVFGNPGITPPLGNTVPDAELFGLDLAVRRGDDLVRVEFGVLVLVVLIGVVALVVNLTRGSAGQALLAVRSNERAAAAAGIDVTAIKLMVFGVSSFLAGLAGGLLGYSRGQISVGSFTALVGVSFLAYAYLGGITSVSGALIAGALAPLGIGYVVLNDVLGEQFARYYLLVVGAAAAGDVDPQPDRDRPVRSRPRVRGSACAGARRGSTVAVGRGAGMSVALSVTDLTVGYGGLVANDSVSLEVRAGQVVGLIGPNGAGKSTFVDAVSGFTPYSGCVAIGERPLDGLPPHKRRRLGLSRTWQSVELFDDLSVRANVAAAHRTVTPWSFLGDLVRPGRHAASSEVDEILQSMDLATVATAMPGGLSLGQRKRLGVARALAGRPVGDVARRAGVRARPDRAPPTRRAHPSPRRRRARRALDRARRRHGARHL